MNRDRQRPEKHASYWIAGFGADWPRSIEEYSFAGESRRGPSVVNRTKADLARTDGQALAHEFDGTVTMDFRPQGLVVTLDAALPAAAGDKP